MCRQSFHDVGKPKQVSQSGAQSTNLMCRQSLHDVGKPKQVSESGAQLGSYLYPLTQHPGALRDLTAGQDRHHHKGLGAVATVGKYEISLIN